MSYSALTEEIDVNTKITNFLNTHAEKLTKEQWLKKYSKPTEEAYGLERAGRKPLLPSPP